MCVQVEEASAMSDFIWSLIMGGMLVLLGLVFIGLGLAIWKKQKIELIIRYHMDKVSEENKQAYCKLCGIGLLIPGIGFVISGIGMMTTLELYIWIPMVAGLAAGILLLIISVVRYNH